ncbi:uncharacterized protein BDV14DRAFT_163179 [Aspergillus stella-maris]|uniref:uncharacterized protein n=1 Tax=Aspergillus stella-maris TaxID=1810926 RepID=UPI003CCCD9EF
MVRNRARLSAASSSLLPFASCLTWRGVLRRRLAGRLYCRFESHSWIVDGSWIINQPAGVRLNEPVISSAILRLATAQHAPER